MDQDLITRLELLERRMRDEISEELSIEFAESVAELLDDTRQEIQKLVSKKNSLSETLKNAEDRIQELSDENDSIKKAMLEAEERAAILRKETDRLAAENKSLSLRMKPSYSSRYSGYYKTAILSLSVFILIVAGYFLLSRVDWGTGRKAAVKEAVPSIAPWPKEPLRLNVDRFKISIISLGTDDLKNLIIPFADETGGYYYYSIEIDAGKGLIDEKFIKSPRISFIDKDGALVKADGAGSESRIVYVYIKGAPGKEAASLFRCIILLKKNYRPVGVVIENISGSDSYKIMSL